MRKNAFLFLSLCMTIIVSSCSGFIKLEQIQSTDYFSGIKCIIPLKIPFASPTSEYLHTNDTIEELKCKLDAISEKEKNFTTEYLSYDALMVIYSENSEKALFLFHEYSSKYSSQNEELRYKYKYRFSDFSAYLTVITEKAKEDDIQGIKGIPIPHHLFEEMSSGHYSIEGERLVKGNIDDFFKFYQTIKEYYVESPIEIKKNDNVLTLENIPVAFDIFGEAGALLTEPGILKRVTLTFSENNDNQTIVTFSFSL